MGMFGTFYGTTLNPLSVLLYVLLGCFLVAATRVHEIGHSGVETRVDALK